MNIQISYNLKEKEYQINDLSLNHTEKREKNINRKGKIP